MNDEILERESVAAAIREKRPLREARGYEIATAGMDLLFRTVVLQDPIPLGRQILRAAGYPADDGQALCAILATGDFEEVRLEETFDLRERGVEKFVVFEADRLFRFTLAGSQILWGAPNVRGEALYVLANPQEGEGIFRDVPGGTDVLISPEDVLDLTQPGVERFIVASKPVQFEIVVNSRPHIVREKRVTFEQVVELAFPGPHDANVRFTMTYRHAASQPHAGELSAGQSVEVKHSGTIFNVTRTVQS